MLYTDGVILTIQDLREHDSFVLDVASTEAIELSAKLAVAQRELGYEISSFLMTRCPGVGLGHVVVTGQLRDLLATHTLSAVYRDAYNLHLNDRYLGRWKEFTKASERGLLRFFQNGVGLAAMPVPQAKSPQVTVSGDGALPQGHYAVQIAWRHLTGNVGERSTPVLVDLSSDGSITVVPGESGLGLGGWDVFIGALDQTLLRQNDAVLSAGSSWTQGAALRSDLIGPETSGPDYYVRNSGQIARG